MDYESAIVCYAKPRERESASFLFIPMDQLVGWGNFRASMKYTAKEKTNTSKAIMKIETQCLLLREKHPINMH